MDKETIALTPHDLIPQRLKPATIKLKTAEGKELGELLFDKTFEPIACLVAQVKMIRGKLSGSGDAFVYDVQSREEFFTIESWDADKRILIARLKA